MNKGILFGLLILSAPFITYANLSIDAPAQMSTLQVSSILNGKCQTDLDSVKLTISTLPGQIITACKNNLWSYTLNTIYTKLSNGQTRIVAQQTTLQDSKTYLVDKTTPVAKPPPINQTLLKFEKTYLEKADLTSMSILRPSTLTEAVAQLKTAAPNTRIILPAGNFENQNLTFLGTGDIDRPIIIEGAPGSDGTVFSKKVNLAIKGRYVLFNNIKIKNYDSAVYGSGGVNIYFNSCFKCGFYNSIIQDSVPALMRGQDDTRHFKFITIAPTSQSVEIAQNTFRNKQNAGSIILIQRVTNRTTVNEGHRIYSNKFLDRKLSPNYPQPANDFDSIRIGDSSSSQSPAPAMATAALQNGIIVGNIIENNLFENTRLSEPNYSECIQSNQWKNPTCTGEPEVVSIKAPQTIVRFNTFRNNSGGLTIRHGFQSIIEGNYFFGPAQNSYGIRVIGDSHLIFNNHLENLNSESSLQAGISIYSAQTNPALHLYWPVFDSIIAMNYLENVGTKPISLASDFGRDGKNIAPQKSVIAYTATKGALPAFKNFAPSEDYFSGLSFLQNFFDGPSLGVTKPIALPKTIQNENSVNDLLKSTESKKSELIQKLQEKSSAESANKMNHLMKFLILNNQKLEDVLKPIEN